ncbi:hypothetical protein C0992_005640 [Termitomyces sp. T32_za158]|nr:hypothetical protein C0992_005640 [Termitomyces sp. T32_za158]
MSVKIYTSPLPPTPIDPSSVFTHLWGVSPSTPDRIGDHSGALPAYIDATSATALTRAQVRDLALHVGGALRSHTDINARRGDVVLIFSPNSLCWPIALFGSVAAGLRCTLANSAYTPKELRFQYEDSGAGLVFVAEDLTLVVFAMFELLGISAHEARKRVVVLENSLEWAGGPPASKSDAVRGLKTLAGLINAGAKLAHEERFDGEQANETVYLCYSSGTTGKPKGVETTHLNVNTVLESVRPAFPKLTPGKDVMLGMLPFYHIYGMVKLLHFPTLSGVPLVTMPCFDPVKFCAHIERYRITTALIVPPVLVVLARHPGASRARRCWCNE